MKGDERRGIWIVGKAHYGICVCIYIYIYTYIHILVEEIEFLRH